MGALSKQNMIPKRSRFNDGTVESITKDSIKNHLNGIGRIIEYAPVQEGTKKYEIISISEGNIKRG
jgi:hypothetical protein